MNVTAIALLVSRYDSAVSATLWPPASHDAHAATTTAAVTANTAAGGPARFPDSSNFYVAVAAPNSTGGGASTIEFFCD